MAEPRDDPNDFAGFGDGGHPFRDRLAEIRARLDRGFYANQEGSDDIRWLLSEVERFRISNADYAAGNQYYHRENARLREALERIEVWATNWTMGPDENLNAVRTIASHALADPGTEEPPAGRQDWNPRGDGENL